MPSLTRDEARQRAQLITVDRMEVDLDLDRGAEHFGSTTRIRFSCSTPGESTFLDVRPVSCERIELNGIQVDPATLFEGRLPLTDLGAENVVEVVATMAYSRDGQGLHRSTDPADDEDYVYGHLFLDAAPTVFACFDQPDLKAPYAVTVRAPESWVVLGNGRATRGDDSTWQLSETLPLATYFVTVCAGPYVSVHDEHDGIPLGIHARRSLQPELERHAPQMFEVTKQSFDHYHRTFDVRYPFGDYDQVFVPEFNAGAMENPGCVTFRDQMLHRGAATREQVLQRSNTISHEMAHMWFGDLVTMRWWDDLWLNESFAEFMAYTCTSAATEFTDSWVEFGIARKQWGYAAERAPSTHPVAGSPAPDAQSALANFDGISYAKGASVLRQLVAHMGEAAFNAGVTAYLRSHEHGNGQLSEFLAAMEEAHGESLADWSAAWLETAGVDVIALDRDGTLTRTAPDAHPANRTHTLDVAGFTDGAEVARESVRLDGPSVHVDLADATVRLPNASDLTWAQVDLDAATLAALPTDLARIADPVARSVVWGAVLTGVYRSTVDPAVALDVFTATWPHESHDALMTRVAHAFDHRIVPQFVRDEARGDAAARLGVAALAAFESAEPGSDRALVAARFLAETSTDSERLTAWVEARSLPAGLEGDSDFRWLVLQRLARLDLAPDDLVDRVSADDTTLSGHLAALAARAARPGIRDKEWAWGEITTNRERSNYELNALAAGFWSSGAVDDMRPYAGRYVSDIPRLAEWLGADALDRVATLAFPSRVVEDATAELVRSAMGRPDVSSGVRRSMGDELSKLEEALTSRARWA
ncbi:aminopeptidase N [Knoellia subterranea]|uniref:Aminopeptidase N n=1 Tax=Knoellia subterranea KCTC 19937 TaxID=1385521 RepID=A0A0A0JQF5_9MICO|nr:aminopeptidase N [Knoellia subterranea]KGN38267.1 aminopeptidase N [Knoellia subterranea KCTC 19937]